MAVTTGTKLAAGFVLLVALVFGQGKCQDKLCNVLNATSCYWNVAVTYVVRGAVSQLPAQPVHLAKLCAAYKELPLVSECTLYYAGCSEEVRKHFLVQEHGYRIVQKDILDRAKCEGLATLNSCIGSTSLLQHCRVSLNMAPTVQNAGNNLKASSNLGICLMKALSPCSKGEHHYAKDHIVNSYNLALWELFYHDSVSIPHVEPAAREPKTLPFNTTDAIPTPTPASRSRAAVVLSLGASTLLLIVTIWIHIV
ncbi:uncharacterized protein LOC125940517 [Dermacentor silvarum]|uniref:uncharacterized protein LOC125940517 n=1 Tax=Dermacentor silvarum TaxID=543639 RepID=UPI002101B756|nr:uncharacterized protein LOC125940517 [Dermacentor silvarum]